MYMQFILILAFIQLPIMINGIKFSLDCNYIDLPLSPSFTGNLSQNNRLQEATYLAKGKIIGPETLEITKDGLIFTGLATGEVVTVDMTGNVKRIAIIGNVTDESICNPSSTGLPKSNPKCGRPLGLRLRGNILYVADAFYGIVKIDITTGGKAIILSSQDERFGEKPLKFTNDLDIDDQGVIYFVDTSYLRDVNDFLNEYFEAQPRGRLFSYNEKTNELKLLLEDLYFPNGIQLTPNKDMNTMARIIKYGLRDGKVDVFGVLPGFSDSIRLSPNQTVLVPFGVARYSIFYSLLDLLGKLPLVRNLLGTLIGSENIFKVAAKYGLLVEYSLNGQILKSWQDPSGKIVDSTSSAAIFGNKVFMGSLYMDYIAVVNY